MAVSDHFLFISHVSEDRPIALEIVAELERIGIRCWIAPRDVRAGLPFDDEIAEAIEASGSMLLIFSERCNDSEYIRREVTVAGESNKRIIPFRIEDAWPRKGLRVRLSDLHWIDGFVARERAIEDLTRALAPFSYTEQCKPDEKEQQRRREDHRRPISSTLTPTEFLKLARARRLWPRLFTNRYLTAVAMVLTAVGAVIFAITFASEIIYLVVLSLSR